jgi:hypothetical protein
MSPSLRSYLRKIRQLSAIADWIAKLYFKIRKNTTSVKKYKAGYAGCRNGSDNMPRILRRILTIAALAAVVFFVTVGTISWFVHQNDPPHVADAPWEIDTSSRIYFAQQVSILPDKNPQIKGYWYSDGGGYRYVDGILPFPRKLYGPVNIIKRPPK